MGSRDASAHEGHERARVDAAGEERAERHVGHHLAHDRLLQALAQRFDRVAIAPRSERHRRGVPIALHLHASVAPGQIAGRRQLPHVLQDGPGCDDVFVGEELVERLGIELARDFGPDEQRLHFRRQPQALGSLAPVERLLAGAVAGRHERPGAPVPQRKREHPAKARKQVHAPLLVAVDQDLDVRARSELVAERLELLLQVGEVVDLAVGDELDLTGLVGERLLPAGEVHDGQPPHGEADAT